MRTVHDLKTWPKHWAEIAAGRKRFEARRNDRNFAVGDVLYLREFDPIEGEHTGRVITVEVTHLLPGGGFGIEPGHVVMSIRSLPTTPEDRP